MGVGEDLELEGEACGESFEQAADAPLAGFDAADDGGVVARGGVGDEFVEWAALGVVEGGVVAGDGAGVEVVGEVAHRGEEEHGALDVAGDVARFVDGLGHEHGVAGEARGAEGGGVGVELIAEDDDERGAVWG